MPSTPPRMQSNADLLLIMTAFFWGITFAVVKNAVSRVDVFLFLAQRFSLAFVLLLPLCLWRWERFSWKVVQHGLQLGVLLFGVFAFQTVGLQYTTASNAGFLTGLNVVLVPLIGAWFFKEMIGLDTYLAVTLAAAGLFLLCTDGAWTLNIGDLLVMACAVCVALQIIGTGVYCRQSDVCWLTALELGVVAALSWAVAWWRGLAVLAWRPEIAWALLICSLYATVFAFLVQTSMQRFTTPTRTALIFCLEPVFGAFYAAWLRSEKLGDWAVVGAALIVSAMILAAVKPLRPGFGLGRKGREDQP